MTVQMAVTTGVVPWQGIVREGVNLIVYDFTAAQLKTILSEPVAVIPALGANTVIVPFAGCFQYFAGSVGFTNDTGIIFGVGAKPVLTSGDDPGDGVIVFSATIPQVAMLGMIADNEPQDNHANQPAFLQGVTADPDGLGNGTARLSVLYYVMTLLS